MKTEAQLQEFLDSYRIDPDVAAKFPEYRVLLIACSGLTGGASDAASEAFLAAAEDQAKAMVEETKPEDLPHMQAWREAYRGFGAKPQRTRNSAEAMLRRVDGGMPRINRVADIYNAISLEYAMPCGGENIDAYEGAPRLVFADGTEEFATISGGEDAVEHPEVGEVIWRDDAGVTCRRWNWRQCFRTALHEDTSEVVFLLDAMGPLSDEELLRAGAALVEELGRAGEFTHVQRVLRAAE